MFTLVDQLPPHSKPRKNKIPTPVAWQKLYSEEVLSLRRGSHRLQQTSGSERTMRTCLRGCPVICRATPLIEVAARHLRSRQRVSHLQLLHAAARPRWPECWYTARKAGGDICLSLETLLTGSHRVQAPFLAQGHGTVSKPLMDHGK